MKYRTIHNRVERQEFTLSDRDVKQAVLEHLKSQRMLCALPANAREEVEIEVLDESHDDFLKVTRRWIYDDEPAAADPSGETR